MSFFVHDDRVQQVSSNKPANSSSTAFGIAGSAVAGFIKFEAMHDPITRAIIATGDRVAYCAAIDSLFEVGIGTISTSAHTLTGTTVLSNSLGTTANIDFSAASAGPALTCPASAFLGQIAANHTRGGTPGARVTLVQGSPVAADVTGATTIYAEPFGGDALPMFLDTAGVISFAPKLPSSSVSKALGTLAAVLPHDVFIDFGVTAAGVYSLTFVAWTSATARATAVDWIGGYQYKTGDYRFLLLATIDPTTTTTVSDSVLLRNVNNAYIGNQTRRPMDSGTSAGNSYTTGAWQEYTASTRLGFVLANPQSIVIAAKPQVSGGTSAAIYGGASVDRVNGGDIIVSGPLGVNGVAANISAITPTLVIGRHYIAQVQYGATGGSFAGDQATTSIMG